MSGNRFASRAVLDPQTRRFNWTPDFSQAGTYLIRFDATDGNRADSESVEFRVTNANRPRLIADLPPLLAQEGLPSRSQRQGGDLDGENVSYYVASGLPTGATYDSVTGVFNWTPGFD